MNRGTSHTRGIRRAVIAISIALALVVTACGSSDSSSSSTSPPTTVDVAAATAYVDKGPYSVGTTTLDLNGRKIEVWYPADSVPAGAQQVVFEIRDLLPENLKSLVPDDLNPKYPTDAYRDIPASSKGNFPLVLFAHGYAGYPTEYQFLLTHLASWGMVVAGPDFNERGLLAALTGGGKTTDETAVMFATRDLLGAASAQPDGLLTGKVDTSETATMGHSAGVGSAVGAAAKDPSIKTFIAMSGGRAPGAATDTTGTTFADLAVPPQPGMVMVGGKDQVAQADRVRSFFDVLNPPKRLVVVDDGGHNTFNDLCLFGKDQGGLIAIATQVGIAPTEQITRLFNDGCTADYIPVEQAWPAIRHFATAQLRYYLGLDPEPVGLGDGTGAVFLPTGITYVNVAS
jgi:predicted dienelactone hydrolase